MLVTRRHVCALCACVRLCVSECGVAACFMYSLTVAPSQHVYFSLLMLKYFEGKQCFE